MAVPLTFGQILGILITTFTQWPDYRTWHNSRSTLRDAALSAFSVFFMYCLARSDSKWPLKQKRRRCT